MTNEEKAAEIGREWFYINGHNPAYRGALAMAKWKDKQMIGKARMFADTRQSLMWAIQEIAYNGVDSRITKDNDYTVRAERDGRRMRIEAISGECSVITYLNISDILYVDSEEGGMEGTNGVADIIATELLRRVLECDHSVTVNIVVVRDDDDFLHMSMITAKEDE